MTHENCLLKTGFEITATTWTDLLLELEVLLSRLREHGRAFAIVRALGPEDVFVQAGLSAEGIFRVEAPVDLLNPECPCSNRHPLGLDQSARLLQLGWNPPSGLGDAYLCPLWWREADAGWAFPEMLFSELLVRTLVEVFSVGSPRLLTTEIGNMPRQGGFSRNW